MGPLTRFFDTLFRKFTPDPFVIAAILGFIVFLLGISSTETTSYQMIGYWGDGFWKIISFTLQMVMILVGGYVIAVAPPLRRFLALLSKPVKTPGQAIIVTTLISIMASWLNWGLGLVVGAFVAREMAARVSKANFRYLVASAYTGFIVWHGGLSGSIPLVVNTPGNFSEKLMEGTLGLEQTLFSSFNLMALGAMVIVLPLINWIISRTEDAYPVKISNSKPPKKSERGDTPAEKLEMAPWVNLLLFGMGGFYIYYLINEGEFRVDLNRMNFLFFFAGLVLHGNPKSFVTAVVEASNKVGPLLIQYPLYAGIMAMMTQSGLAAQISQFFVDISSPKTFPIWTFLSAGLVNLFVPSGGGQWAVQAPIVVPAAQTLGVDMGRAVMAVAWGDAWTNLAQPFWALPVLSIAGLKVKDIMGFCVMVLMVSGVVLCGCLLI